MTEKTLRFYNLDELMFGYGRIDCKGQIVYSKRERQIIRNRAALLSLSHHSGKYVSFRSCLTFTQVKVESLSFLLTSITDLKGIDKKAGTD